MDVKIDIILLQDPCSACFIIENLAKEVFNKIQIQYPVLELNYIILEGFKEIHRIEGLEVEKFPAIIFNGEQITAGTIPDRNLIISMIERSMKQHA